MSFGVKFAHLPLDGFTDSRKYIKKVHWNHSFSCQVFEVLDLNTSYWKGSVSHKDMFSEKRQPIGSFTFRLKSSRYVYNLEVVNTPCRIWTLVESEVLNVTLKPEKHDIDCY